MARALRDKKTRHVTVMAEARRVSKLLGIQLITRTVPDDYWYEMWLDTERAPRQEHPSHSLWVAQRLLPAPALDRLRRLYNRLKAHHRRNGGRWGSYNQAKRYLLLLALKEIV